MEEATADVLEQKAAEHGVSVATLLAEWLELDELAPRSDPDIAELNGRWSSVEKGAPTATQEEVEHWLATWGTQDFHLWRDR